MNVKLSNHNTKSSNGQGERRLKKVATQKSQPIISKSESPSAPAPLLDRLSQLLIEYQESIHWVAIDASCDSELENGMKKYASIILQKLLQDDETPDTPNDQAHRCRPTKPSNLTERDGGIRCGVLLGDTKHIMVADTGLTENELRTLRQYFRLKHPEIAKGLLFPSKKNIQDLQWGEAEYAPLKDKDEFHAFHRRLYILAKQYMDALGNPEAPNAEFEGMDNQHQPQQECNVA